MDTTEQAARDDRIFAINEWCLSAKVSPALYFKEKRAGRGPRTAHVGRRTVILETPREYFDRIGREAPSARKAG